MAPFDKTHKDQIRNILDLQEALKTKQSEVGEAVKKLADELDVKPAVVTRLVTLVRKERNNHGTLDGEQEILDIAIEAAK